MNRRYPETMTVIATYQCTAACEHCCFGSHPGITERLPLERILHHIDQAAALASINLVVFTGGECFLLGQDLIAAVARCTHRLQPVRIECIGRSPAARSTACAAGEAGLGTNVHRDAHQAFVLPDRIVTRCAPPPG